MTALLVLVGVLSLQGPVPEPPFSGGVITYEVKSGASLASVGARYGVPLTTLAADNGLSPTSALKPGQRLVIDNRHVLPAHPADAIVINVPQRMLFVFVAGRLAGAYAVAVGRADWRTPLGDFVVSKKEVDPTWDVPKSIQEEMSAAGRAVQAQVPPGPDNPLGDRWIGVSNLGLGIHGTNQPTSIYRFTTHGCIRLHPADAQSLFDLAWIGMPIRIVYQPVLAALVDADHVMVEVHADVYDRARAPRMEIVRRLEELDATIDLNLIAEVVRRKAGRGIVIERAGVPALKSTW
jgi:L,D-transpeptidase ErfK/SrfK